MTAQRVRVRFSKGERVRYISHLDVLRFWERAMRRAELPLAYSQGFTPHPKLAFAGPLPVGFLGEAEIVEATLTERVPVEEFAARLREQDSEDLRVLDVREIPANGPSPQASLRWAEYRVDLPTLPIEEGREAVERFLTLDSLDWQEQRGDRVREYDLRSVVATLVAKPVNGGTRLLMRLRSDPELTGRPEPVVEAVAPGHEPSLFVRTALILHEPSPARDAWRRKGRFE